MRDNEILKLMKDLLNAGNRLNCLNLGYVEDIVIFSQMWPSTTLGFGGIGGDMLTPAYTLAILCSTDLSKGTPYWHIFFGGKFAYVVNPNNLTFRQDLMSHFLKSVADAREAYKEVEND